MRSWLAYGRAAVVAGNASAGSLRRVHKPGLGPVSVIMALITIGFGLYVIDRFGRGIHLSALCVAGCAAGRRASENTAHMTVFAGDPLVAPSELKSCLQVIKLRGFFFRCSGLRTYGQTDTKGPYDRKACAHGSQNLNGSRSKCLFHRVLLTSWSIIRISLNDLVLWQC